MALGFALRAMHVAWLDANVYIVLGLPLTLVHQRWIRKAPLRALWVREALPSPRPRLAGALGIAAAVMPFLSLGRAIRAHRIQGIAWSAAVIVGAAAFGYAASSMTRRDARSFAGSMLTSGVLGSGLMVLALIARVFVNHEPGPAPMVALREGADSLALYVPACFALEEVTFRGMVDDDLRDERRGVGLLTAILSSALWGLWHLPTMSFANASVVATIVSLTFVHTLLGVPLALFHRRSGNLVGVAVTHAFIDAVRNALVGIPG